jgi:hypothetical protein
LEITIELTYNKLKLKVCDNGSFGGKVLIPSVQNKSGKPQFQSFSLEKLISKNLKKKIILKIVKVINFPGAL